MKLHPVTDDSKNYLEAVDQSGKGTRVNGLSDGTRDQLYFALRLAALTQYFENNEPQPVILDDAFVAFDDDRCELACAVLAEFSSTTQVIYFTHHRATVDSARAAIPSESLAIQEIPSRWTRTPDEEAALVGAPT